MQKLTDISFLYSFCNIIEMVIGAFGFVALAVACNVINKLLDRYVARDTSPYAFSWLTQLVASLLFLPLAWPYLALPGSGMAWVAISIAAVIWTIISISVYLSIKKTEVSIKEPISQSKVIWALLLGFFVLGEAMTTKKIIGTIILFIGISVLLFHPERKFGRLTDPGVLWTLGVALLSAIAAIVDKFALGYFRPELYGFLVYLIPGIILTGFLPKIKSDVKHLLKLHGKIAITTIIFSSAAYFFTIKAYSLADITTVYPFLQLATIFAVIFGILFLGEREHKWQKIAAAIIAVIGAIIIKI